jgi:hypothetical protein
MKPDSSVHRVYAKFDSLEEFKEQAMHAVAAAVSGRPYETAAVAEPARDPIPAPPELYAEPRYIGSHRFVGRAAQLDVLNDWAVPADSHPCFCSMRSARRERAC